MENFRILELFSGIGGMHYAFNHSGLPGEIMAAVDINPVANCVYKHNFPEVKLLNNNIQKLTPRTLEELRPNVILMSPPCQPFTRIGQKRGLDDTRSDALKHICSILKDLPSIDYVLMENVKGFETSEARSLFTMALQSAGFFYREFILSPSQFGIPNTRYRYFCLARRTSDFQFPGSRILDEFPVKLSERQKLISDFLQLDEEIAEEVQLSDEILRKRIMIMDIVTPNDKNSCCFTKAYTHYAEGTGSVLCPASKAHLKSTFQEIKNLQRDSNEWIETVKKLQLRYFTPQEVSRLMCFPNVFSFPDSTLNKQRYRLLGNSINILVVGELIKLLCS